MKSIIRQSFLLLCLAAFQLVATAQDNTPVRALFEGTHPLAKDQLGFWLSPGYAYTQMDGGGASLFHLRGGLNMRDKFTLGGYANISFNRIMPQSENVPDIYMDYWSVGGFAEYTLFSHKLFHLTFPLYVGYGEVEMDDEEGRANLGEANFFQVEPSALVEINLHKYVRFNIGGGYRIVGQMNYRNFNQSAISGPTGYVALKFGLFR